MVLCIGLHIHMSHPFSHPIMRTFLYCCVVKGGEMNVVDENDNMRQILARMFAQGERETSESESEYDDDDSDGEAEDSYWAGIAGENREDGEDSNDMGDSTGSDNSDFEAGDSSSAIWNRISWAHSSWSVNHVYFESDCHITWDEIVDDDTSHDRGYGATVLAG